MLFASRNDSFMNSAKRGMSEESGEARLATRVTLRYRFAA